MAFFKTVYSGISYIGGAIGSGLSSIGSSISNINFGSPKPYVIERPITCQRLINLAKQINMLVEFEGKPRLYKTAGDGVVVEDDTSIRNIKDRCNMSQSPQLVSRFVFEFFKKAYEDLPTIPDQDQKTLQTTITALDKQANLFNERNYALAIEYIHNLMFKQKINDYLSVLGDAKASFSAKKITDEDCSSFIKTTRTILVSSTWFNQWIKHFNDTSPLECALQGRELLKFIDPVYSEPDITPDAIVVEQVEVE